MSMDLNKGAFAQLGPMYNQLLSMSPDQIMQAGAPEFLKIAAMQQQGRARQAMLAPTPPSSTVAQDVVQTVAPTGIGALPTSPAPVASGPTLAAAPAPTAQMASGGLVDLETSPDMFNDRYYADGGIVAFANGGEATKQYWAAQDQAEDERDQFFRTGTPLPRDRAIEQWIASKEDGPNKELLIKRYIQDRGLDPSMAMGLVRQGKMAAGVVEPELGVEEARTAMGYTAPTSGKDVDKRKNIVEGEITEPAATEPSYFDNIMGQLEGAMPAGSSGIGSLGSAPTRPPLEFAPEERALSYEEAIAQKKAALDAAGVDREAEKSRRQKMLDEKSAEYEERSRLALPEMLITAGLATAAGTSQNALENIAKGAQQGFASYKEVVKELKADKDLLDELESKNAEAEYAERLGDAEYANQLVRENEARRREAANNKVNQINTYNLEGYKIDAQKHENAINRMHEANLTDSKIRADVILNASKMAQELTIAREKLATDLQTATLGMQASTLKSLTSVIDKGMMNEKQYTEAVQTLMQDPSVVGAVEDWVEKHSTATEDQIYKYRVSKATEKLKAIVSTRSNFNATNKYIEEYRSFIQNNSSGLSGLTLERVKE